MSTPPPHIGTLGEQALHASLKHWYAQPGDRIEVPVDSFVVDIVRNDLLVEIQTARVSSLKRKVMTLLADGHRIRIVHPIAETSWIVRVDDDGAELSRRRSPRHRGFIDLFSELVGIPDLIGHDRVGFEPILIHQEEIRRHQPGKAWRRKGWVVDERRLVGVVDARLIESAEDAVELLPSGLPDLFTTSDVRDAAGCTLRAAQQAMYCLRKAGIVATDGKRSNSVLYRRP